MTLNIIHDFDSTQQTEADPIGLKPHEFIQLLYEKIPQGFVEITYLAPEGVKLYPHTVVQWATLPLGELDPELPNIKAMNAKGYSCYFGCAVKGVKHEPEQRTSDKTGKPYTVDGVGYTFDDALAVVTASAETGGDDVRE